MAIVRFQPGWRCKSVGGGRRARKEVDMKRLFTTNTHRDFQGKLIVFSKPLTTQWPHSSPKWKELQHVISAGWIIVFMLNRDAWHLPHCVFQIMRRERAGHASCFIPAVGRVLLYQLVLLALVCEWSPGLQWMCCSGAPSISPAASWCKTKAD